MGKPSRARPLCSVCHKIRPYQTGHTRCSKCRDQHRCRSCGFEFPAGGDICMCRDCADGLNKFRACYEALGYTRCPANLRDAMIWYYAGRVAEGLPLWSDRRHMP